MSSSSRPERRKSALTGLTAFNAGQTAEPVAPRLTEVANVQQEPRPVARNKKVSFYQSADDANRVRAALVHTQTVEGVRSLSELVAGAVMKEVERLEREYNDGKPFAAVGSLPPGPPARI